MKAHTAVAAALLIAIVLPVMSSHVASQNRVEGKHIIVVSPQVGLIQNPTAWIADLDTAYEAMRELAGGDVVAFATPDGKITLQEDPSISGAAYAGNPVRVSPDLFRYLVTVSWNKDGDPGFGFIHELGHDFHDDFPGFQWNDAGSWTQEAFANLFLCYAYEHIQPRNILIADKLWTAQTLEQGFYGNAAATYLSGHRSFDNLRKSNDAFTGLMLQLKDRYGWQLYQKAFAAQRSMDKSQIPTDDISKAQFFADILSKAAGAGLAPTLRDWGFPVQSKSARLDVSASPNPVQITGGQSGTVDYRLSETNGVGVTISSEQWVFIYPDGSEGPSGTDTERIRINALSSVDWTRWPPLLSEVADRAAANGWSSVVLRYTFVGTDDYGSSVSASYDLTIIPSSTNKGMCTTYPFLCSVQTIGLAAAAVLVAVAVVSFHRARRKKVKAYRQISSRQETRFCIVCGIQVPLDAKYCDNCGASQQ